MSERETAESGDVGAGAPAANDAVRPPLVESSELLRGHRSIDIHHKGELYRLQETRTGKLILTK